MTQTTGHINEPFQPVAAVLAFVAPGLGHAYLGEKRRGLYVCIGVLGLFFGGILVGGIDVVDRRENFLWFLGQAVVGPVAFGTDYVHQTAFKGIDPETGVLRSAYPDEVRRKSDRHPRTGAALGRSVWFLVRPAEGEQGAPPNIKSLGRVNEMGTLMCTIAGMMNLICILDAAFRHRRERTGARGIIGDL